MECKGCARPSARHVPAGDPTRVVRQDLVSERCLSVFIFLSSHVGFGGSCPHRPPEKVAGEHLILSSHGATHLVITIENQALVRVHSARAEKTDDPTSDPEEAHWGRPGLGPGS